jgi:TonB family protein
MARHHTSAPNGPETFQQLKALLGRLPTVDELSRELDPVPGGRGSGRRFMVVGAVCLPLLAVGLFLGRPWSPELPPTPAVETTVEPALPVIEPPPLPAIAEVPIRRAEPPAVPPPARAKTRSPIRRLTPLPVKDAATIQQRVVPDPSPRARRTITGRIRINVGVSVDPSGNVTAANSLSPDASKYFNGLAVKAAQDWKFAPASTDRGDAAREWVLRFEFTRQDTTATVVP